MQKIARNITYNVHPSFRIYPHYVYEISGGIDENEIVRDGLAVIIIND